MTYTLANAEADLKRLGTYRTRQAVEIGEAGDPDDISGDLLIAHSSRETNCRNINGGGYFDPPTSTDPDDFVETNEDAGALQLNRGYHEAFLRSVPGCDEGSWTESYFDSDGAFPKWRVPGWTRAAKKARSILRYNRTYAISQGIPTENGRYGNDALLVAVCGYNGGAGRAVQAYKRGDHPDVITTGRNYGTDVLDRRSKIKRARRRLGW